MCRGKTMSDCVDDDVVVVGDDDGTKRWKTRMKREKWKFGEGCSSRCTIVLIILVAAVVVVVVALHYWY